MSSPNAESENTLCTNSILGQTVCSTKVTNATQPTVQSGEQKNESSADDKTPTNQVQVPSSLISPSSNHHSSLTNQKENSTNIEGL